MVTFLNESDRSFVTAPPDMSSGWSLRCSWKLIDTQRKGNSGSCPSGPTHLRVNVNYMWPSYLLMCDPGLWVLLKGVMKASQTTHNVLQQNLWGTLLFLSVRLLEGTFWHIQVIFSSKESHSSVHCTVSLSNSFPEWSKMWQPQGQLIFTMGNKSKKFTVWVLLKPYVMDHPAQGELMKKLGITVSEDTLCCSNTRSGCCDTFQTGEHWPEITGQPRSGKP